MLARFASWLLATLCVCIGPLTAARARADAASIAVALEAQLQALESQPATLRGARVTWPELLHEFYALRGFRPVWDRSAAVAELLRAVRASLDDGLDPEDYFLTPLAALQRELSSADAAETSRAAFEVLCSEALLRLCYHLRFGKVDARAFDPQWNYGRALPAEARIVELMAKLVDAPDLFDRIEALKPTHNLYVGLKRELARYRGLAEAGGYRPIPAGAPLREGIVDDRVVQLRKRLGATGDMAPTTELTPRFDAALTAAVTQFQTRVGLPATGVIDARTLGELNVPVSARIDQIRVNLDRGRVLLHDLPAQFLVVNVAAFEAMVVRDGQVVWKGRVQVGKPLRRTPIFRATLSYLVLNPTWTVPPSIIAQDILPEAQRSATAITRRHLKVYDRDGRELDPARIAWSKFRAGTIPYVLRQDPGAHNALGRVKLMFPNSYAVYIHDTPAQELFEAGERSFSSGCVRVERALSLAQLLLNDPVKWGEAQLAQVVASERTTQVQLPKTLPVLLTYWTAWPDPQQRVHFRRDAYERDAHWLERLNAGFAVHKPLLAATAP